MSEVHILDEIVLQPDDIETVLRLLDTQYLPGLSARQTLRLGQRWVSPPVRLADQPNTLWLLWTVTDIYGYYAMRGTAGPEVAAFWAAVDKRCLHRHRHVLGDAGQPLPGPLEDL
jgi:hypothetical protein